MAAALKLTTVIADKTKPMGSRPNDTNINFRSSQSALHGGHDVLAVSTARNRKVYFYSGLCIRRHIDVTTARFIAVLRQLHARHSSVHIAVHYMHTLMTSLVLSRLDYCNSVLYGLPAPSTNRLKTGQNAAARLVFNIRWTE